MKRLFVFVASALAVTSLAACYKNPTVAIPPAPTRTYIANPAFVGASAGVAVFAQPLGPGSVPIFTLGVANGIVATPIAVLFDGSHNLFVLDDVAQNVLIFSQPITPTSMPAATINNPAFANAVDFALDKLGNLWVVSSANNSIYEYSPPFSSASTSVLTVTGTTPALNAPSGIAFDNLDNMYVSQQFSSTILVFPGPVAFATPTASAIISGNPEPEGIAFDVKGRMFVGDFATGNVYVYNPPLATGVLPKFHISPPFVSGAFSSEAAFISMDSSGVLYVPYQLDGATGNVSAFAPPFNSGSAPIFSLSQPGGPNSVTFGP